MFSVGLFACADASCAEQRIGCQPEYPGKELSLAIVPHDWTFIAPSKLLLASMFVVVGPPAERGILQGDHYKLKKKGAYEVRFKHLNLIREYDKWIACSYSSDDIQIVRRLPPEVEQCIVTYTPGPQGQPAIDAVCK